jgi:putative membrane protein
VANYGTGFAPYFIPLALWVGALVTFFLLKPVSGRALMSGASNRVVAFAGYWPAAAIGSAQAVIMLIVVQTGLGLTLKLPVLTYGLTILTALTFVALIQWLGFSLGSAPGKLAGIVLLMLQLTSAAGTFPIETVPTFFRAIHPFLPMTYVVEGLRQTIAGGDVTVVVRCVAALCVFLVIGLVGTLLAVRRQRTVTMARLRPALAL